MAENRPKIRLVAADGTRLGVYADYTKNVRETMPTASAEYADVSVLYVGKQTDDFTPGHLYTCTQIGLVYNWVDVTPIGGSNGSASIVVEHTFVTTEATGTTVTIDKDTLGVTDAYPEYDVIDEQGYNVSADTRIARRWNKESGEYELVYIGGWPKGSWTLKSVGQATTSLSGYTYSKAEIHALINDNVSGGGGGESVDSIIRNYAYSKGEVDNLIDKAIPDIGEYAYSKSEVDDLVNERNAEIITVAGTVVTLNPLPENAYIICSNSLSSLTVSSFIKTTKESVILFTVGSSFSASFPETLKWAYYPTFRAGKTYALVVNYGVVACAEVAAR